VYGLKDLKKKCTLKMMNNSVTKHPNEGEVALYNYEYELCKVPQHERKPVIFTLTKNMNKKNALFKQRWCPSFSNKHRCKKKFFTSFVKGYRRTPGCKRTVVNDKE
jgi:hypothetical protein